MRFLLVSKCAGTILPVCPQKIDARLVHATYQKCDRRRVLAHQDGGRSARESQKDEDCLPKLPKKVSAGSVTSRSAQPQSDVACEIRESQERVHKANISLDAYPSHLSSSLSSRETTLITSHPVTVFILHDASFTRRFDRRRRFGWCFRPQYSQ